MKKLITVILCAAMLASMICMLPVSVSAGDDTVVTPELVITEIDCNPKGTDFYEYIEILNTSDTDIDLYDYMIGYCGEKLTHEQYEKAIVETTPIKKDWMDKGAKSYNDNGELVYTDYTMENVTNPESGVIAPGEVAVLWFVCGDCYNASKNPPNPMNFRGSWNVPADVKIFAIDANGSATDRNFNLKNSNTGTYVIMKNDEQVLQKTNTVPIVKEDIVKEGNVIVPVNTDSTIYYTANGYMDDPLIITWATLDFVGTDSPCYKLCAEAGVIDGDGIKSQNNSIEFIYNAENMKRAVPSAYGANTVGVLSEAQKAFYAKPETPENPDVTTVPGGDVTTPIPEGDVTTVPGGDVTTVPGGDVTTVPGGDVTTVPGGDVTTVPGGDVTTVPGGDATTVPGGDATTVPGGDVTTVPGGDDTTTVPGDNDTTTVVGTPTEPDTTTKKPDEPKKSCGGFAVAAQLIMVLGAAVTVVVIKKK